MPPKHQSLKIAEHQARLKQRADNARKENEETKAYYKKQQEERAVQQQTDAAQPLSKKEQRALNNANKKLALEALKTSSATTSGSLVDLTKAAAVINQNEMHISNAVSATVTLQKDSEQLAAEQAIADVKAEPITSDHAAVPWNHSTHCPGVTQVVARLSRELASCTIILGKVHTEKKHCDPFQLVLSTKDETKENDTTFKFTAKNGFVRQDVTITVKNKLHTKSIILAAIERAITAEKAERIPDKSFSELPTSSYNHALSALRKGEQLMKRVEKDKKKQEQEVEIKDEHLIREQEKRLQGKVAKNQIRDHAVRNKKIVGGETRTRYSMQ